MTDEGTRPHPGFLVRVWREDEDGFMHEVGGGALAHALQDVYDIAVNSMDFGSGFLDTDEIRNLRVLGKAIGAEPLHYKDTPDGFHCRFTTGINIYGKKYCDPKPCTCGAEGF